MEKLYDVKVTFDANSFPGRVNAVGLRGEFLFYKSGLTGHTDETGMIDCTEKFPPEKYSEGLDHIGGLYYKEMQRNADGVYEVSMKLPAGVYPYHFLINPDLGAPAEDPRFSWSNMLDGSGRMLGLNNLTDALRSGFAGETNHVAADPANPPAVATVSGRQMNSELYVGLPEDSARIPIVDPAKRGTISYHSYTDINGSIQSAGIYFPAGYDKDRTYPLVIVSHGGGGNEADWFCQGSLANILDNMIAEGRTREAIVVTPNNGVYPHPETNWDFDAIARNIEQCLIPYVERICHISPDVKDRAFCGLSMGSMTTLYMYYHRTDRYAYYGAFSGGIAPGHPAFDISNPRQKNAALMIGSAEEDIAYNFREIGVPTTIAALKEAGIPYIPYFVPGSHDWFCWPDMFEHFAEAVLWKE